MGKKDKKKEKEAEKETQSEEKVASEDDMSAAGGYNRRVRSKQMYDKLHPSEKVETNALEIIEEESLGNNMSLFMSIASQLRIGMDLTRIVLPTFILEPRSMLEKLTDFMIHGDLLLEVPPVDDPLARFMKVLTWYFSGFYVRPKGVKKPYNPILGEVFRCAWQNDPSIMPHCKQSSTTFYVGEQVCHHPPVSAFYCSNRKAGYVISGSIHPKSRFLGTSAAAMMEGFARLYLIDRPGEYYDLTFPNAYARGIIWGKLLMELCGEIKVECPATGLKAEVDFKAKPMFGGTYNIIKGAVTSMPKSKKDKKEKETYYTINGKWSDKIEATDLKKETVTLWDNTGKTRYPKQLPGFDQQDEWESRRLWLLVSQAIVVDDDQKEATEQKAILEDAQRKAKDERTEAKTEWTPKFFQTNSEGNWEYKHINTAPYDPNEAPESEQNFIIGSKHAAPNSVANPAEVGESSASAAQTTE